MNATMPFCAAPIVQPPPEAWGFCDHPNWDEATRGCPDCGMGQCERDDGFRRQILVKRPTPIPRIQLDPRNPPCPKERT